VPPTASTFALKTTSKPNIANVAGFYKPEGGSHSQRGASLTFGRPKGSLKPETTSFTKKGTGNPVLPPHGTLTKFQYNDDQKRPPVPKKDEKKYVPTAKALEQVAESVSLPTAPEDLARPASPPRLTAVVEEETAPSS
jgi:hypothetical protein